MSVGSAIRSAFTRDLGLKLLALALAILAWMYSHGEQTREATFVTPVEYLFPPELVLLNDDPLPEQVVIVASGTRAALSRTREMPLRYVVDLEQAMAGTTEYSFRQPPSGFPERLRISTVSPAMIRVRFDEQARRTVPVELRVRGELPAGFVETSRSVQPEEVTLVGARSELEALDSIATTPLRINHYTSGFDGELTIDTTGLHLLPESTSRVQAKVAVEEVLAERELGGVTVALSAGLQVIPGLEVEPEGAVVRLRGPSTVLDMLRPAALRLEVGGPIEAAPSPGQSVNVPWRQGERAEGVLGTALRIDHPRSDRVEVLGVEPAALTVSRVEDELPEE